VGHLRANGCGPQATCFLYLVTDGEETVRPSASLGAEWL
jgi:hypothetical protein